MARLTTSRLIDFGADAGKLMDDKTLNDIRLKLATAYANYLGDDPSKAKWPEKIEIARFHWAVFGEYGIHPRAYGGTPLGQFMAEHFPSIGIMFDKNYYPGAPGWCYANCR
jgi:hypothetical protein